LIIINIYSQNLLYSSSRSSTGGGGSSSSRTAAVATSPGRSSNGSGRNVSRLPSLPADVTRCGLRQTQPGNQK